LEAHVDQGRYGATVMRAESMNTNQSAPLWVRLAIVAGSVAATLVTITYELYKRRSSFIVVVPIVAGECLIWNKAHRAWENAGCESTDDTYLPGANRP